MKEKYTEIENLKKLEDSSSNSNEEVSGGGEGFIRRNPILEKKPLHAFGHQLLSKFLNEENPEPERTVKKLDRKEIHPARLKK